MCVCCVSIAIIYEALRTYYMIMDLRHTNTVVMEWCSIRCLSPSIYDAWLTEFFNGSHSLCFPNKTVFFYLQVIISRLTMFNLKQTPVWLYGLQQTTIAIIRVTPWNPSQYTDRKMNTFVMYLTKLNARRFRITARVTNSHKTSVLPGTSTASRKMKHCCCQSNCRMVRSVDRGYQWNVSC